ncbi:MAG: shikimate kinase [Longimicrobiales bacterium]
MTIDRVVLVGFMAAGKSAVGERLAELLGWRFIDLDREIERQCDTSVAEIFAQRGEVAFRELEAEATSQVSGIRPAVIAPGGGWALRPGLVETLRPALVVRLRVSAEEAVRRARSTTAMRPLLAAADPLGRARTLLAARDAEYARADAAVETEGRSIDDIAREIYNLVRG